MPTNGTPVPPSATGTAVPSFAPDSSRAWVIVFAAFLVSFVTFGVTYSFGVFLKPLEAEFHTRHFFITGLFSSLALVACSLAPLTGKIADRYGPRPLIAMGALLMGGGLILTARVQFFPLMFLTYGLGVGAAVACTYIPVIAAVGQWFKVRRAMAIGISISGVGCGTLVAAPLSADLIERYGWRTAYDVFGWASAAILLLCAMLLFRPPEVTGRKGPDIMTALRTPAFFFLYASLLFARIAMYVSLVYLPAYSADIGIGRVAGAALVGYIGGSSIGGRLGFNALASRMGLLRMYQAAYAILLASFVLWLVAGSYVSLLGFTLVMGIGYGGVAAMYAPVTASIFGVEELGELLGILFTGFGLGSLFGPPLAAALVDYTHDYKYPVLVATAAAALALLLVLPLRKYAMVHMNRLVAGENCHARRESNSRPSGS
jgi:MFS family permease